MAGVAAPTTDEFAALRGLITTPQVFLARSPIWALLHMRSTASKTRLVAAFATCSGRASSTTPSRWSSKSRRVWCGSRRIFVVFILCSPPLTKLLRGCLVRGRSYPKPVSVGPYEVLRLGVLRLASPSRAPVVPCLRAWVVGGGKSRSERTNAVRDWAGGLSGSTSITSEVLWRADQPAGEAVDHVLASRLFSTRADSRCLW
jgi:hypothetical protein